MQRHPKFGEVIYGEFQYDFRVNKVSGLGLHSSFHEISIFKRFLKHLWTTVNEFCEEINLGSEKILTDLQFSWLGV